MYCRYCGKENKDEDKFCFNCGRELIENTIEQTYLKQEKKNFLPWIVTGISSAVVLTTAVFCIYMFMGKDSEQKQADNEISKIIGAEETDNKSKSASSDNYSSGDGKTGEEKSNQREASEDIFSKGNKIVGRDDNKEEEIVTKLVRTGLYRDGREVCRVKFNAKASSQLKSEKYFYGVSNLWDLDENTCWAEGVKGYGKDEKITYTSNKKQLISGIAILPGYLKSEDLFYKNSRPSKLEIKIGSKEYYVDCYSSYYPYFPIDYIGDYMLYYDFEKPIAAKKCIVKIADIYNGSKYKDTCISEMFFYYIE